MATSSTTASGARRSTAASAAPPSARGLDLVALGAERPHEHAQHRRVVVDDEDARAHAGDASAPGRGAQAEDVHGSRDDERRP